MASELFGVEGEANSLWSGELAPVEPEERTGKALNLGLVWAAMALSLPVYLYASCLSALGASVAVVVGSALAGSVLAAAVAAGCGHAGVRYGIPFAVLARTAFGVVGARVPVVLRLLACCVWVGIGCWLGASAASYAFELLGPLAPGRLLWICFAFALVAVAAPSKGGRPSVVPALWGACLLLLLTVAMPIELMARGFTILHPDPSLPVWPQLPNGHGIALGVTAMLGLWLPLALGAADGARRVPTQRAHAGSLGAMIVGTVLLSGVVALTARLMGGGPYVWNPLLLADGATHLLSAVASLLLLAVAALLTARAVCGWLAGEVAATMPRRVFISAGRWLAGVVAALTMPWRWVASPERYLGEWLSGCAGMLAPVAAILLVEYFALRRRWLNVDDLYQRDGLYEYAGGWNWKAFGALAVGWLAMGFVSFAPSFAAWRGGAVWIGAGVSAAAYWVLRSGPPEVAQIPPTPLLIPLAGFETEGASS